MQNITVDEEMKIIMELDGIIEDWLKMNEGRVSYYAFIGYLEELKDRLLTDDEDED